jgi:hypothetical protein
MPLGYTSYATKVLITKGCHLGPATNGMITGGRRFHLYVQRPEPRKNRAFGGGPYPGPAWNKVDDINKFYQPVNQRTTRESAEIPFYHLPVERESEFFAKRINVVMKISLGEKEVEKIYSVNERWEKSAVRIVEMINSTYDKMMPIVENIKRVIKNK